MLQQTARAIADALGHESRLINSLRPAYESVLGWGYRGRGIPWTINGVEFRIDPHQRHRLGQEYDAPVAQFLQERIKPGWTCWDVGANVGAYVLQLANWSRPSGRVVAFEPNPAAREILDRHVLWNDMRDRVSIVDAAVSSEPGFATFYATEADGMSRLGAPNVQIAERAYAQQVPVVTLDQYLAKSGIAPDALIVDVEGFEFAVLDGARDLIRSKRDLLIVVEMHPDLWPSAGTDGRCAIEILRELELRVVPLQHQPDPVIDHGIVHLAQQ